MAIDALTFQAVQNREDVWGRTRTNVFDVTLSAGYPVGGYTLSPAILGLKVVHAVILCGSTDVFARSLIPYLNITTGRLQIVNNLTGAEAAAETNLGSETLRIRFEGE